MSKLYTSMLIQALGPIRYPLHLAQSDYPFHPPPKGKPLPTPDDIYVTLIDIHVHIPSTTSMSVLYTSMLIQALGPIR